jgi:hypothetical protein
MKNQRHLIISITYILVCLFTYHKVLQADGNPFIFFGVVTLLTSPLFGSLFIRKRPESEYFFASPYNFFTEKVNFTQEYKIDKELLIDKITEVINNSDLEIINIDRNTFKIFAISNLFNLYLSFISEKDYTKVNICCTTTYGFGWGLNKKKINTLINNIEESLII